MGDTDFPGGSVVKNLPADAGDMRFRFNLWLRKIPLNRKWQPTAVFWPEKSQEQRTLRSYSLWGCKSWTWLSAYAHTHTNTDAYEGVLVLHFVWEEGRLPGEVAFEISGPFWQMIYSRVNRGELQFCRSVVWPVLALPLTSA